MTIFNKTCTFNVGNDALLMTKVTSLRLCLCQFHRTFLKVMKRNLRIPPLLSPIIPYLPRMEIPTLKFHIFRVSVLSSYETPLGYIRLGVKARSFAAGGKIHASPSHTSGFSVSLSRSSQTSSSVSNRSHLSFSPSFHKTVHILFLLSY